jgi:hypothetical protein
MVVALWMVVSRVASPLAGVVSGVLGFGILYMLYRALNGVGIDRTKFLTSREIDMVEVTRSVA